MKFAIDTEFNGMGGELLSLALVPWDEEAPSLYLRVPVREPIRLDPWVKQNVWPLMDRVPDDIRYGAADNVSLVCSVSAWGPIIARYLTDEFNRFGVPYIIADWPDDIAYFCKAIITGPGEMAAIPRVQFDIVRVDPYEAGSAPVGAVRHNAWWDAVALRDHLKKHSAP